MRHCRGDRGAVGGDLGVGAGVPRSGRASGTSGVLPVAASARPAPGVTQASAVPVTDWARPTTVSVGLPGAVGERQPRARLYGRGRRRPSRSAPGPSPSVPVDEADVVDPACGVRPADEGQRRQSMPAGSASESEAVCGRADRVRNGPARRSRRTRVRLPRAAAAVTFVPSNCAVRWAPCCLAKAWSNGAPGGDQQSGGEDRRGHRHQRGQDHHRRSARGAARRRRAPPGPGRSSDHRRGVPGVPDDPAVDQLDGAGRAGFGEASGRG